MLAGKRVAVVFALGTIVRGGGGSAPWTQESYLGSDDFATVLRDVGEDRAVAAVVLRIDSPGGSALASDFMLREIEKLKEKKPVVVSMSDEAASGGYYIAAKANKIVAEPATLTGSIGIFGGKFVTRRFEEEILGLGHDTQKRGANADIYSTLQPYTPQQEVRIQQLMDHTYQAFVGHVATGRRMSRSAVEGDRRRPGLDRRGGPEDRPGRRARRARPRRRDRPPAGADRRRRDGRPRLLSGAAVVARSVRREAPAAPSGRSRGGGQEPRDRRSAPAGAAAGSGADRPALLKA